MAYNPFNIFRRNQKAIFAVLTVFIMFMFVLSSGLGGGADFFDWFPRWIGGTRGGEKLCKIDGDDITNKDLEKVRFKRVMANRFMELSSRYTESAIHDYLVQQQARVGAEGQAALTGTLQVLTMLENPRIAPLIYQQLPLMIEDLNRTIDSPSARPEDKDTARAAQALLRLIYQRDPAGGHYFLNAPNKTQRDVIDFMLWQKKADKLGISFGEDDVKQLIQREFYGFFKSDVQVRDQLKDMPGFTMDGCLKALAIEFKVRAAQKAILGHGGLGAPAYVPPWELFDYYRDQCSPAVYEVVAVPADAFVEKVIAEPTDKEIDALYTKHKDDEPRPNRDTPGFKQPRKIAVGWLSATGEEPYYRKLAEEHLRVGEVMAKSSGMLTVPVPGVGGAWFAGAGGPLAMKEPLVYDDYHLRAVRLFEINMRNQYSSPSMFASDLLPSSIVRPGVLASTAGAMGGQLPFGHPTVAASLMMGSSMGYETRDRVKVGVPLVLGFAPSPAMIPTIAGAGAASRLSEPKPLSVEAMKPELLKARIEREAKELMLMDLAIFSKNLQMISGNVKLRNPEDVVTAVGYVIQSSATGAKPTEKLIKDFVALRGIQSGGSSTSSAKPGLPPTPVLRDEWTLEEDPGLQPLVLAQKDSVGRASPFHGSEYIPFGRKFFWTESFNLQGRTRVPSTGLYVAQFYPEERPTPDPISVGSPKPQYVVWRTADTPAAPTTIVSAREDVVKAWKKQKARELALQRANALAQTIKNTPGESWYVITGQLKDEVAKLRDEVTNNDKAKGRVRQFTLSGVCPLAPQAESAPDPFNPQSMPRAGAVQPFNLSESENIPFPTPDMTKMLLDNRDKPPRTVVVMPDAGQNTFYVATLLRRDQKDTQDFKNKVYSQMGGARRAVTQSYLFETMRKSRLSVNELLKREFKYEETEEQKKKLDENAKSGGRD